MRFTKTLSFSITLMLVAITTLLVAILFINNRYAMNVVRNQVVQSYRDLLPRFVEKQDDNLSEIQNYLIRNLNHAAENEDIRALNTAPRESDAYHLAASNLFLRMGRDIISYSFADILFVYSSENDSLVSFSSNTARKINSIDENLMKSVQTASFSFISSRWQLVNLGDTPGLLCMSTDGAGSFMGAWVSLVHLLYEDTDQADQAGRGMVLMSQNGSTYTGTGNILNLERMVTHAKDFLSDSPQSLTIPDTPLGYLLIVEKSSKCDLYFVEAIKERMLLSSLPSFQIMIYLILIIMVLVFIACFAYFQRIIVMPMHSLTRGMSAVGRGQVRVLLQESGADEIRFVIRSFNEMTTQIETLRIENYERQLRAQQAEIETKKAELRSMQLQINPHFFANSLNIIYSLSAIRDYQTIQKMALLLSRYFRYIMHSGEGLTDLQSELSFVRDYLDIQKLRFTKRLLYEIDIHPDFSSVPIPPLTIQPFVENAIVHGFTGPAKPLEVRVEVLPDTSPDYCLIRILDNGNGFAATQLTAFSDPQFISNGASRHIGVWNVQSRLGMTFGDEASLFILNRPDGGACIEMRLPVSFQAEQDNWHPSNAKAGTAEPLMSQRLNQTNSPG